MKSDTLFANPQTEQIDFSFNESVVDVFPDMIRRSVPGYQLILSLISVIARKHVQKSSSIYDLGCSLGAATLSIYQQLQQQRDIHYICVDNSQSMIKRCQKILNRHLPLEQFKLICSDIEAVEIQQASVIVMNFTLQFIEKQQRLAILQKIHQGLLKQGILILSEKIYFSDKEQQTLQCHLHDEFKRMNGYTDLEISQKRTALENVLIPDTLEVHRQRLYDAGFTQVQVYFQSFNFISLLAKK